MTTVSQNITHWSGDDLVMRFVVKDSAGAPVDLSGASAKWWMSKVATSRADSNILIKKSSDDDQQITIDHPNSYWRVLVRLVPSDTENITAAPTTYYHECQVVLASGIVATVAIGKFKLNPTIIPDP